MRPRRKSYRLEHIDLLSVPREEARRAMSQIEGVHRVCWPEKTMEMVYADRLDRDAVDNQLWLVRGPSDEVIGFMHGIGEDVELDGTPVRLLRSLVAVLPAWRRTLEGLERHAAGPFVKAALRGRLAGRLPLLLAFIATPATYRTFVRLMPQVVPASGEAPDPRLLRLRDAALAHLGLERVPGRAHAYRGPRLAMSAEERAHWTSHQAPEVRFFVEQCPGFSEGEYLASVIPMDWTHLAQVPFHVSVGLAREWARRRTRRLRGGAPHDRADHLAGDVHRSPLADTVRRAP